MALHRLFRLSEQNVFSGSGRLASLSNLTGLPGIGRLLRGVTALVSIAAMGVALPASSADAYPEAVAFSRKAAQAVLAQDGRESCLRGKLTKALLKLSDSCDASGQRNPLCALASKAVVETPMSLTFMEDTSRKLLELSSGEVPPTPGGR